jgi:hypothetical protein
LLILSFPKGRKYWKQKPTKKARKRDAIVKNKNHALKNISSWTADNNYWWWNFLTPALKHIMLQNGEISNTPNSCSVVSSKLSTKNLSSWYQLA